MLVKQSAGLGLSALCLYSCCSWLCSNTCKKQLDGGKVSLGSWFRGYSPAWIGRHGRGWGLFMAADDNFLTSLWIKME